jgi:hypothetical protein
MTARSSVRLRLIGVVGLALGMLAGPAQAQWQVTSADGVSSLKLGVLLQPQAELIETADGEDHSQNLFLRRARILMGGTYSEKWSFFLETDSPNLGKGRTDGSKTSDLFIQDVFVTYSTGDAFKVDAGMLLMPLSHNHETSAGMLLPVDYGAFTFSASDSTASKVGRDYGVEARGYVLDKRLEYRVGAFQGYRGSDLADGGGAGSEPFRILARAVWYPFEAETGYFYTGASLGTKKILALGASYDVQGSYSTVGADLFYDQPIASGALTFQADWARLDGDDFLTSLPEQDTWLVEASYFSKSLRLGPFVQLASRSFALEDASHPDEDRMQLGLAWWISGHKVNLKGAWARLTKDGFPDRDQALLQLQLFWY